MSVTETAHGSWAKATKGWLSRLHDGAGFLPVLLVLEVIILSLFAPHFLDLHNIVNVLRASALLVIASAGQMLVLIVGGFDLSVDAAVALTSVVSASVMVAMGHAFGHEPGLAIGLGVAAGLIAGAAIGLVNGLCVAFLRVSPFMVTLATMSVATGVAFLLTSGMPIYGMPKPYVAQFGRGLWFGLPASFYLAAAVVAVVWVLQNRTRLGRHIHAVGGNLQAALVSGVRVKTCLVITYVACSLLAAIAGLSITAEIGSGEAAMGTSLTLESIAAAVIAGVSLKGGIGRVELVTLGAIFLVMLTNAMDLFHVDSKVQVIFLGVIVVAVVAVDEVAKRRKRLA
ncbi:MAG: ABC transporter permease [Acetobacteraceae bacterium]